jgi:pilus assembly protein Flp/PilA
MLIPKRFFADDSGATAIEYGLIAGVMAIAIVTCASIFTSKTAVVFSIITSAMDAATG